MCLIIYLNYIHEKIWLHMLVLLPKHVKSLIAYRMRDVLNLPM